VAPIIDDTTVRRLLTMPDAIDALRETYAAFARGDVLEAERSNLIVPPAGFLRIMAAAWPERELAGYKEFHRFNGQVRYTYHLFDTTAGEPLAILDAYHLTALRTGACGGLAAELVSDPSATTLGVIGSGAEARSQIAAIRAVRPIERIQVYSRTAERRERLCDELGDVEAVPMSEPAQALAGAAIVVVATNTGSTGPALLGEWLDAPGVHVNSIGSTLPHQREIDPEVWARSDRIVIDAAVLLAESGDAIAARAAGTLDEDRISLLGDVVAGTEPGRVHEGERTLYKSVGSAIQDLSLAIRAYERARPHADTLPSVPDFHSVAVMDG
jgi:alanine dehydrogenase